MIRKNIDWQYGMTEQLSHFINFSDHKPLTTSIVIPKEALFKIPVINTKLLNQHLFLLKEKPKKNFDYMKICNNPSFYGVKYIDYEIIINKKFSESIEATKALLSQKNQKSFITQYNILETQNIIKRKVLS
ncbi:unnamed protein product [Paramecium octaurelia]|uniref:Uncharacterized protein n=1 Tax=Paramecium octaurelia TaxID=43137 RepID=A0A8S1UQX8_PAROT|nr:unnamed protein product [Paramecium octaurelia]